MRIRVAYFKPSLVTSDDMLDNYRANRLTVVKELEYATKHADKGNRLDLTLFLNGIPVATAELKNPLTGQNVEHAKAQYKTARDPSEPLFARRVPGQPGGAGNPPADPGRYPTSYLWKQIWQRQLARPAGTVRAPAQGEGTQRPRQQADHLPPAITSGNAVRQLTAHAARHGAGHNYLVMASAGSGKSNTIGWLAHRLSSLHTPVDPAALDPQAVADGLKPGEPVFDKVLIITDRRNLDAQLRETVGSFEQTAGLVVKVDEKQGAKSEQLARALSRESGKIVTVTLHTFPALIDYPKQNPTEIRGSRFAIVVDEAHSSQSGDAATAVRATLRDLGLDADTDDDGAVAARPGDDDTERALRAKAEQRGQAANLSYFAFTATPKHKTLELFGTPDGSRTYRPFHTYSMRQAIEEGFILGQREYRILVVAEKYQTGFDQPLLTTMYVNKTLTGISAVQTLSRINRTAPGKSQADLAVLDFVNEAEHIQATFQPFYEQATTLPSDPNLLYNAQSRVMSPPILVEAEIRAFAKVYLDAEKHAGASEAKWQQWHPELYRHLEPAAGRFTELAGAQDEEDREQAEAFRADLNEYVRKYSFLSQIVPYRDEELEALYLFGRFLLTKLPPRRDGVVDIGEVELSHLRVVKTGEHDLGLEPEGPALTQGFGDGAGSAQEPEKSLLSELIDKFNERHGIDFTEDDFARPYYETADDPRVRQAAVANENVDKLWRRVRRGVRGQDGRTHRHYRQPRRAVLRLRQELQALAQPQRPQRRQADDPLPGRRDRRRRVRVQARHTATNSIMPDTIFGESISCASNREACMDGFVGRNHELRVLDRMLARVATGSRGGRPGRALLMRGRRRVGKSRLVEEFLARVEVPHLYFTASAQPSLQADLRLFVEAARASSLPGAATFDGQDPSTWDAALHLLVHALPRDRASVIVLDEMPYLIANDSGFEGTLQKLFDREFARLPVLLICVGSDLAMMEALNEYGRPFHQRATEMVIPALNPADVAEMLDLPAAEAFDAYLVSGGLPLILDDWPTATTVMEYLADTIMDPTSALLVSGERSIAAEFPAESHTRRVLAAVGAGERTFSRIARAAGDLSQASLARALQILVRKRVVVAATPLSTRRSRETRYSVADPHLRFWLPFLGPYLSEVERGRGDLALARIQASWQSWRGRAIEPVVRESLRRLPERLPTGTGAVGGYWTRSNHPEVDLVGADREPVAETVTLVGSIKWLDDRPFDTRDLGELVRDREQVPGANTGTELLVVSRTGAAVEGVHVLTPDDLLTAWRHGEGP